jgi:acetyl esterase/lipase
VAATAYWFITAEGVAPARFFNSIGVTVFVLKYRLGRDTLSPYKIDVHAKADGYRAMRLVRSRAAEWAIDTNRIGLMGFSAGGEVVDMIAFKDTKGDPKATDPIDRANAKPNFIIQVYPGPSYIPDVISADAPPAFLVAANDDVCCSPPLIQLLQRYRDAKVPVEMHLYARGDHAFNMGTNRKLKSINNWPQRLADWMEDSHYLQPEKDLKKVLH